MKYNRQVLENGLSVLTIPMPSFESVTVLVMVGAGSRYETKANNGISHFLEHMAFKGTTSRPSALTISTLIDGIGGEVNAFTGKETTGYYIKSGANHIDLSMDVLSDMLRHSLLDEAEIEKEKGVIIEELNLYEDTPTRRIGDLYERLLYGDTPMGWDIGGEKEIIQKIKRSDFTTYLADFYSADNITVVVAGGVESEKAVTLAKKYFGPMEKFAHQSYIPVSETQKKPEFLLKQKNTEQVHVAIGYRTVDVNHKDRHALSILASVLGGGMSSRLFSEVREKRGLAYYVRSSSDHYMDCGSLVSFAGVDAKRVEDAVAVIKKQYDAVQSGKEKIEAKELEKAREYVKGHMVLELEDSRSVAGYYAVQELTEEKIDNPDEVLAQLDGVTVEEVNHVAKTYLTPERLNVAVIGNFADTQLFEKVIK